MYFLSFYLPCPKNMVYKSRLRDLLFKSKLPGLTDLRGYFQQNISVVFAEYDVICNKSSRILHALVSIFGGLLLQR